MAAEFCTLLPRRSLPPLHFPPKREQTSSIMRTLLQFHSFNIKVAPLNRKLCLCGLGRDLADTKGVDERNEFNSRWELEFLGEIPSSRPEIAGKKKPQERSRLLEETESLDWCVRARKVALRAIEARGLSSSVERMVTPKKKNKKKIGKILQFPSAGSGFSSFQKTS